MRKSERNLYLQCSKQKILIVPYLPGQVNCKINRE